MLNVGFSGSAVTGGAVSVDASDSTSTDGAGTGAGAETLGAEFSTVSFLLSVTNVKDTCADAAGFSFGVDVEELCRVCVEGVLTWGSGFDVASVFSTFSTSSLTVTLSASVHHRLTKQQILLQQVP